jgi:hypothetical protein
MCFAVLGPNLPDAPISFPVTLQKFPARRRREFGYDGRAILDFFAARDGPFQPKIAKFPVFSLFNREFGAETGSLETASSASQSPWLRLLAAGSEKPRHSAPLYKELVAKMQAAAFQICYPGSSHSTQKTSSLYQQLVSSRLI